MASPSPFASFGLGADSLDMPFDDAAAEIKRCSDSQFDPKVVEVFLRTITGEGRAVN